jgi:hypothetical protein
VSVPKPHPHAVTAVLRSNEHKRATAGPAIAWLSYLALRNESAFVRLLPMSDVDKRVEIQGLRHQLAVRQRHVDRPASIRPDRAGRADHRRVACTAGFVRAGRGAGARAPHRTATRCLLTTTGSLSVRN